MEEHDWSKFHLRIDIKAPVEKVYQAWATRDGLENWFLRVAEFTKPGGDGRDRQIAVEAGDIFKWHWHGWDDKTVENGKILEANSKDLLRFTFGGCEVRVVVKTEESETICELWQTGIPTDEKSKVGIHLSCSVGWTLYLANLKSMLEGGPDLRNRNVALKNMVNS